jgi:hypothetical protein
MDESGGECKLHVLLSLRGLRAGVQVAGSQSIGVASDTGVDSGTKAVSGSRDDTAEHLLYAVVKRLNNYLNGGSG